MKNYITININKNTLNSIGKIILIIGIISILIFMSYCSFNYVFIGSYNDGYNALANEIKDGMDKTECGNYMLLSMKKFKIKLYKEDCLYFFELNKTSHNSETKQEKVK